MEELRNYLLQNNLIDLYEDFLQFMASPDKCDSQAIVDKAPSEIRDLLCCELNKIVLLYATDRNQYQHLYTFGQNIIWCEILNTYQLLFHQMKIIESCTLSPDLSNYEKAVGELKRILTPYTKMQIALSDLEETLGVDRFLDRISESTFAVLRGLLVRAKAQVERKTEHYKEQFQSIYNNTHISSIIAHSLIRRDDDNQICDQFVCNEEQIILFIIDGFGFCQYLWNCGIDTKQQTFTFKENLFSWLSRNRLSKELILGSSFVTDTGAGLAQIYLGQAASETGIIASKVKSRNCGVNYLETKSIDNNQFLSTFTCSNSITDIISTYRSTSLVYYCSRYQNPPSGFSQCIFKSADVKSIIPPERVFSIVLEDMQNGQSDGLQIIYLTSIDNSGHTMGAYSGFERQEHKKIDLLFRNFLIELAYKMPNLFNGRRHILITADHGMYESSKITISRQEIISYLNICNVRNVKLVENNRALLFYNEGTTDTEQISQYIKDYFSSVNVLVDVQTKNDKGFANSLIGRNSSSTVPDLIARFVGEGLFYSKPCVNDHLLHFGGHGGYSVDEVFVPLLSIPLSSDLLDKINSRFLSKR